VVGEQGGENWACIGKLQRRGEKSQGEGDKKLCDDTKQGKASLSYGTRFKNLR